MIGGGENIFFNQKIERTTECVVAGQIPQNRTQEGWGWFFVYSGETDRFGVGSKTEVQREGRFDTEHRTGICGLSSDRNRGTAKDQKKNRFQMREMTRNENSYRDNEMLNE